ncbi:hypothetical protein 035JT004_67 [Bacillus phage 035JT004]|nr:hypothetical protein 035JT004_67 [Bacillus phage 035JT004]
MKSRYEEVYESYWKNIVEKPNGELDIDKVKRELADYRTMLEEVPAVYEEVSGLTKPLTRADVVITALYDNFIHKEYAIADLEQMAEDGQVSLEQIREYFG